MRHLTILLAFLVTTFTAVAAFAADPQHDTQVVVKPKFGNRFGFILDAGPSISIIKAGTSDDSVIGFAPHVQTNLFVGHRMMSDTTMWISVTGARPSGAMWRRFNATASGSR
jgi:hypothetical protein